MPEHGKEGSSAACTSCFPGSLWSCETSVGPAQECYLLGGSLPLPDPGEWAVGRGPCAGLLLDHLTLSAQPVSWTSPIPVPRTRSEPRAMFLPLVGARAP